MQSTMKSAAASPAMAARCPPTATDAPVERIGTGPGLAGVGMTTVATAAPRRSRATVATSTNSGRLSASANTTAVSPAVTAQRAKWSEKASIRCHGTAMSCSLVLVNRVVGQSS